MKKLYFNLEHIWFKCPEKLRFLLVGGFNTVLAYGVFIALFWLFHGWYNVALVVQYIITINVSFWTMRYYVFQSSGKWRAEYIKAWSVYLFMLGFNAVGLNALVNVCRLDAPVAQAVYIVIATILIYILHKYFSFKPV